MKKIILICILLCIIGLTQGQPGLDLRSNVYGFGYGETYYNNPYSGGSYNYYGGYDSTYYWEQYSNWARWLWWYNR